ncbi:hypothetical protein GCM10007923_54840 [Shinella yambaruensis]|uniref:Response regulatory domain-containing protein n=1 Tax=Shinella yambaruensis TaxID=415996 RepID=A0ABQ5ZQZ2_9HYPH|nr:hypothetical protein GCM10007923_54840 [Shinella yambaruensis]
MSGGDEVAERRPSVRILAASGRTLPQPAQLPEDAVFIRKPLSATVVYQRLLNVHADGAAILRST